jgi:hypothetical protein
MGSGMGDDVSQCMGVEGVPGVPGVAGVPDIVPPR